MDKINELHIVCIEAKQNQITHKYSNYWKHEHLPNFETPQLQDSRTCLLEEFDKLYFPPSQQTHQIVKIHKLSIETAVVEIASKKCCIVLFYSYVMLSVLSLTKIITNGYKVSYTFCFFPQVDRTEKFASKMASLFRPVWRKKNPFLVTLYDSSSKIYTYMYISMHLFLHLSRGSIKKKLAKQVEKRSSPRVSVVPFQLLPSLPQKNSISSGNENKNICCRDFFHEIQAYFDLYSTLPEHFGVWVGPKEHTHEIYGFLAVGKICTWK